MAAIGLDWITLAAALIEAICFGAFTVLFSFTIYVLLYKRRGHVNKLLLGAALLMYTLATAHMGVVIARAVIAFVLVRDSPGGTTAYLAVVSNSSNLVKWALYVTQTLVGDLCMVYRCFIVWHRRWSVISLPLFVWVACSASGYGSIVEFSRKSSDKVFAFAPWIDGLFATSLATNVYCTVMISLRIWGVDRASKGRQNHHSLIPVVVVVVESGAVYSSWLLALFAAYLADSWTHYLFLESMTSIIGLVFCMIISRIGLSMAWKDSTSTMSASELRAMRYKQDFIHITTTVEVEERIDGPDEYAKRKLGSPTWPVGVMIRD